MKKLILSLIFLISSNAAIASEPTIYGGVGKLLESASNMMDDPCYRLKWQHSACLQELLTAEKLVESYGNLPSDPTELNVHSIERHAMIHRDKLRKQCEKSLAIYKKCKEDFKN